MKTCLIIGKVWPEPESTAAGWRTLDIIDALQHWAGEVHFASAAQKNELCADLQSKGVVEHAITLNDSAFDAWVAELNPDIVIFDRYMTEEQFGWRVAAAVPAALRVLDTSDLHCLREARGKALKAGEPLQVSNAVALREIASIYRSDLTLMISRAEMSLLSEVFEIQPPLVAYWPFCVDVENLNTRTRADSLQGRQHCILMGSFMHPPNVDSVNWAIREIWPRVRAHVPDAELHVYGSYSERFQAPKSAEKHGVFIRGRAEDALETFGRYRLSLAPLRYGAGLKGKVLQSWVAGTPVIGTPVAFEGIAAPSEYGGHVACEAETLAERVGEVLQQQAHFLSLQNQGAAVLRKEFSKTDLHASFADLMLSAYENREVNRERNFVGQMLRHHHHRSTEFMSRWIEAKNKSV